MINLDEYEKYVYFKIDFRNNVMNTPCGRYGYMGEDNGKTFDFTKIYPRNDREAYIIQDDRHGAYLAENAVFPVEKPLRRLKPDDNHYNIFKKGELVKIRTTAELKKYYYSDCETIFTQPYTTNTKKLWNFRGKTGKILDVTSTVYGKKFCKVKFEYHNEEHIIGIDCEALEHINKKELIKEAKEREKNKEKIRNIPKPPEDEIVAEMLSKIDMDKIKKIMSGAYGKKATELKGLHTILEEWARAKKDIYLLFGRELKIHMPLDYEMGNSEINANKADLAEKFPVFRRIMMDLSDNSIRENRVSGPFADKYGLKEGMKVTSFLSKATKIENTESLNKLTDEEKELYLKLKEKVTILNPVELEYSRLFSNLTVKGRLVISIDPVDYLLMSVNRSGWDSCYRLTPPSGSSRCFGSHVSGLFSYMCDKSTTIAFRHSNKLYEYHFGGNKIEEYSKNWRQVIYINTDNYTLACSRQYPERNDGLMEHAIKLLGTTIEEYTKLGDCDWKVKVINENSILSEVMPIFSFKSGNSIAYNDIRHRCEGVFAVNTKLATHDELKFEVDSDPVCPICGKNYLYNGGKPMCEECYNGGDW